MLCFKFYQNRTINEEFTNYSGGTRFQKFEKASYRTVVLTHTENFNILAQLENVENSRELIRLLGRF